MKSGEIERLLESRHRLRQAVSVLTDELNAIEEQIAKRQGDQKLGDDFFWGTVITTLAGSPNGLASRQLHETLVSEGNSINLNGLRVLLSRNRAKGNLELGEDQAWRITPQAAETAYRRGLKVRSKSDQD